jgi:hypothetical protein
MKQVLVTALSTFSSTLVGNIESGQSFSTSEAHAKHLAKNGLVELVEEKGVENDSGSDGITAASPKRKRTKRAPKS